MATDEQGELPGQAAAGGDAEDPRLAEARRVTAEREQQELQARREEQENARAEQRAKLQEEERERAAAEAAEDARRLEAKMKRDAEALEELQAESKALADLEQAKEKPTMPSAGGGQRHTRQHKQPRKKMRGR